MAWYKRIAKGIQTMTSEKKEAPDGVWTKCPSCKETYTQADIDDNDNVCSNCQYHFRIGAEGYFDLLFDGSKKYTELDADVEAIDILGFKDLKGYDKRLEAAKKKTGLKDAVRTACGKIKKQDVVISCMDFNFIGGSMGSVMGEKFARGIDYAIEHDMAFMIISKSGGARMMESAFSLMQMAKTTAKLTQLADRKLPYISLLTDPTTGGVTASFASIGDINIAEPGALIGFAGPRVIKETIKKDLPKEFQTSEFVLEHGFLDLIVHRQELKNKIGDLIKLFRS